MPLSQPVTFTSALSILVNGSNPPPPCGHVKSRIHVCTIMNLF
nr:MAG TPA: cholecystokinin A receptor [Caudoviricetes sp.]